MLRPHGIFDYKIEVVSAAASYPKDGLIARWTFDNTLVDTEYGKTLTLQSGTTSYTTGKIGNCLSISNSRWNLTDASIYGIWNGAGTKQYSFSFWAKTSDWAFWSPVISGRQSDSVGAPDIGTGDWSGTLGNTWDNTVHKPGNWMYEAKKGSQADNAWTHIVALRGSSGLQLYINNNLEATTGNTSSLNGTGFWVGGSWDLNRWDGLLDSLYVYNKALSTDEISQLWNGGAGV